jgi:hypothetical protein
MTVKLELVPDESGYSYSDSSDYIQIPLDGGLPRTRKDILDGARFINVTWIVDADWYQYLRQFVAANLLNDSEDFEIDLFLDSPDLTTHLVSFVPDSLKLISQQGLQYTVSATLEALADVLVMDEDGEGDDGDDGNAGVGTGGAGYYPPSASGGVSYTLWDRWHFEESTSATTLTGELGNTMTIYNDDSQKINTSQFYEGSKSLRKGGGSPLENMPELPVHARWQIDLYVYFAANITGSGGYILSTNRFDDWVDEVSFFNDSGTLRLDIGAGAGQEVTLGAWHRLMWKVTDTAREWYWDGTLIETATRASMSFPSTFSVDWTIGKGGGDYYYGEYWFLDLLTCSYYD